MLEHCVPPPDINKISIFSHHLVRYNQEGLLDVKYMEDRYLRGKKYCSDFMETRHKLMCFSSLNLGHAAIVSMQSEMGPLLIDEAISLSQAISSGNANTMCFACLPQVHSSTSMATVMKNRRLLEDKLFAVMNSHEIALNYAPPEHGGVAAMCGTSPAWQRSRALLGSINNIPRSRVQDLQNPDTDHPLAPHWRVQQRGIKATTQVTTSLLDNVLTAPKQPVLVVDLLPSRFAEWSRAAWNLQKRLLNDEDLLENHPDMRIPEMVQKKLVGHPDFLKRCMDDICEDSKFTTIAGMGRMPHQPNLFVAVTKTNSDGVILASSISWHISKDSALIAMADTKAVTTLADLICKVARERGVMEVRTVDHSLAPKVQ
ncbi:unnamed protein product, partial [Durusdinium trenchii]